MKEQNGQDLLGDDGKPTQYLAKNRVAAQQALVDEYMEPLPSAIFAEVSSEILSTAFLTLLYEYSQTAENSNARRVKREEVVDRVNAFINHVDSFPGTYREMILLQTRLNARAHRMTTDLNSLTVYQLLVDIVREEAERQASIATPPRTITNEADYETLNNGTYRALVHDLGLRPTGRFIYEFKFKSLDKSGNYQLILKGAVGGFVVEVSKLIEDATTHKREVYDPKNFPMTRFVGAFGAIGLGYAVDLSFFKRENKNPATGSPIDFEVRSEADLTVADFVNGTVFRFFSLAGPGFKLDLGPGIGIKAGGETDTVASVVISRNPQVILETSIGKGDWTPKVSVPTGSALVKAVKEYYAKWWEAIKAGDPKKVPLPKINAALVALTMSYAWVLAQVNPGRTLMPVPRPSSGKVLGEDLRSQTFDVNALLANVYFAKASSELTEVARDLLEIRLATARSLFESPGWVDVEGTSSPEWGRDAALGRDASRKKNVDLSDGRAHSVANAIADAFGKPGAGCVHAEKDVKPIGKGAEPFYGNFTVVDPASAGQPASVSSLKPDQSLDPYCELAKQDDGKNRINEDSRERYHGMRRVDVVANGIFTVRIPSE